MLRTAVMCLILVQATLAQPTTKTIVLFDKAEVGKLPKGWKADRTGEGDGSVWKVLADESPDGKGGRLAQTAAGPNRLFNLCILEDSSFLDGSLQVQVKAISGDIDQGGGLVWRYVDAKNYYVCRFNPLEKNFRLYHVKDGKRTELASREKIEIPGDQAFVVSVSHTGSKIRCSLNGEHHLDIVDETFMKAGKVGLWTKADAVTSFDRLEIHGK